MNDGGPVSVDSESGRFMMAVCERFTLSLGDLPLCLIRIMPAFPHSSGEWARTVTFTARAQELLGLVAYFTALSHKPEAVKKFTIETVIDWTTEREISKEQRQAITRNTTILGRLLNETGLGEFTPLKESALFAGTISLRIRTTGEGKPPAISNAPSEWPYVLGSPGSLRQWYAGTIALTQFDEELIKLFRNDGCPKTIEETIQYIAALRGRHADALIAALTERDKTSEKST